MLAEDIGSLSPNQVVRALGIYDPLTWAVETAHIRLPKNPEPLNFRQHPFMYDIYRDTHPHIVALKGAQLGFSTWAIIRDLWALATWPISTIYTIGGTDINQHVASRINPLISTSAYLADRLLDVDSVHMKRFSLMPISTLPSYARGKSARIRYLSVMGLSTAYFTGAGSEREAISRDADFLIHDEIDKSDQQVIETFRSRIMGPSIFKWTIKLSTPTYPGYGIDREYRLSDMRRWLIRCAGCNEYAEMTFPESLEPQTFEEHLDSHPTTQVGETCPKCFYRCSKCGRRMDNVERGRGRWVPEIRDPGLPHGYSVSQMAALYVPAVEILRAKKESVWPSTFWNMTMGMAHDEGNAAFTVESIIGIPGTGDTGRTDPNRPMAVSSTQPSFMGVDVGIILDVTIDVIDAGRPRTIAMMRTRDWSELDRLMERFNVQTAVIDALPELTMARNFAARWNRPGQKPRVWRSIYGGAPTGEVNWNDETAQVTSPRARGLSETADELLTKKILPAYDADNPVWKDYIKHMVNSKRVPVFQKGLEREGIVVGYDWVNIGEDHQLHSSNYARLARVAARSHATPTTGLISINRSQLQKAKEGGLPMVNKRRRG